MGEKGLKNIFVSNGYMTRQAIDTIRPFLDGINIDLKSMNDSFYKNICQGKLLSTLGKTRDCKKFSGFRP